MAVKPDNPFRQFLTGNPFGGDWVPIAQHIVGGGAFARPALARAEHPDAILGQNRRIPFQLDGAGPEIITRFVDGEEVHEASLHPRERIGEVEYEPIVIEFDPRGRRGWIEPIQAFVLYWSAWPDHEDDGKIVWRRQLDDGDLEDVARWLPKEGSEYAEGRLELRRRCLLAFLAMFEFDLAVHYTQQLSDVPGLLHGWSDSAVDADRSWRVLTVEVSSGRRLTQLDVIFLIRRPPFANTRQPWQIEDHGGVEYVVGVDSATGEPIRKAHETEEDYLLPVFFNKDVLERYYNDASLYEVEEFSVACRGQWDLRIARTDRDTIHAWLGDVAMLPTTVQQHWQQYSVVDEGGVPDWRLRADLEAEWGMGPEARGVQRLKQAVAAANAAAHAAYSVPLYAAIDPMHEQSVAVLRTPANNSLAAFQEQLRVLAILVVDHINSEFLTAAGADKGGGEGTLARLTKIVASTKRASETEAKELIGGLFAVQALRSNLSAHRTGAEAERALARANISLGRLPQGFDALVDRACDAVVALTAMLEDELGGGAA